MSKESNPRAEVDSIISQYMSELGKRGGSRTTEKKVKSAVDNVSKARVVRQEKMQRWMREAAEAVTHDLISKLQALSPEQLKAQLENGTEFKEELIQTVYSHISRSRGDESQRRKDWKVRHTEKLARTVGSTPVPVSVEREEFALAH